MTEGDDFNTHGSSEESERRLEPEQQMARLNADVPKKLYKAFKAKVVANDTTITEVVNQWIRDYLD